MAYNEQMQALAARFQQETGATIFSLTEVGNWALDSGLWAPNRSSILRQFSSELSRALREEFVTDPQGRRVRTKHAVKQDAEQGTLWGDIFTAPREHMQRAFAQRREQVVNDCRQLRTDVDSYNQNMNTGEPIQMVFDFTDDLNELSYVMA
jgi:hypothetical protein